MSCVRQNTRYSRRKLKGRCVVCGRAIVGSGATVCPRCAERKREREVKEYRSRIDRHVCVVCGKVPPMEGRTQCRKCALKSSDKSIRYYERRRDHANEGRADEGGTNDT